MSIIERDLGMKKHEAVFEIEEKFPVMTDEFKRIQTEQYELFCRKQKNYGPDNISMGSTLEREEDRKLSLEGLFLFAWSTTAFILFFRSSNKMWCKCMGT